MQKYSIFNLVKNAFSGHQNWDLAWKDPTPKKEYDVVIIGGGGHGLATAYYLAKEHNITNVAIIAHNPGVSGLVSYLVKISKPTVLQTWGVAHCQFDSPWHTLSEHTNAKVSLASPKLIMTKTH